MRAELGPTNETASGIHGRSVRDGDFRLTGDLTRRKLIPALYNLASQQLLSREFAVIGVGRSPMSDDDARKKITEDFKRFATAPVDADLWEWFVRRIS